MVATSSFVGRERELEQLRAAFDGACHAEPRLVVLAGEPGIGKTRLAEELAAYARSRGGLALWGRAQEFAGTPPYWPWVQVGRAYRAVTPEATLIEEAGPYAAELQRLFPRIRELIPDLPGPSPSESAEAQFRLFDAMSGFLHQVSARVPLMIVLDDLHWADRSTLQMLLHVTRELPGSRILILGAYRDTDLDRTNPLSGALADLSRERPFERLHLGGLSEQAVAAYVRASATHDIDPAILDRICEATEGNPYFLSEIVALLARDRALSGRSKDAAIAVPEGVKEALGRRLNHLSRETNALLALAAVVGREFDEPLLAALSDEDGESLLRSLDEAFTARVIEEAGAPGEYRFAHALMRETLLSELSPARRVRLHGQVARALESMSAGDLERHAPELAAHYVEAAVLGREYAERAAHFTRLAAEQARAQLAWAEAIRHYERCLELVTGHEDGLGQDEAALWMDLALSGQASGDVRFSAYERAFALWPVDDPVGLARHLLRAFPLLPTFWIVRLFMPRVDEVLARLGPEPTPEGGALYAWKALALRGAEGEDAAERAEAAAEALSLQGVRDSVPVLLRPTVAARDAGRLREAIALAEAQLDPLRRAGFDGVALDLLVHAEWASGDLERSEAALRRMLHFYRERRSGLEQIFLAWLACLEWRRGRRDAMEELLDQLPPVIVGTGVALLRAELALLEGRAGGALAQVEDDVRLPFAFIEAERLGMRCRLLAHLGDSDGARDAFRAWEEAFDRVYHPDLVEYVIALHTLDDVLCEFADEALLRRIRDRLAPLEELRNWWCGSGPDYLRGAIELRLGDVEAAASWFESGLEWATREGVPLVAGRCHQGLAEVAHRRGEIASARKHLEDAAERFEVSDAALYLEQVAAKRSVLRSTRAGREARPDRLSAREVEVLLLIAAGKSNRDIAETLVISLNTVERHVNHIYTKTGLANRVELAAYAREHELT